MRSEMEEYSNELTKKLVSRKEQQIKTLTEVNNQKYKEIKTYYNDITASNLALIKQLKNELN